MSATPVLQAGQRVGPYVVQREIGRGATAVVVLASDERGEEVAVKVRGRGIPAADRRFLREFESMRALRLPGVVRVFEAGLTERLVWFSMEYVDGATFLEAARAVSDPVGRVDAALDLTCQLLDVLTRLHAAGLAHRDIKPSNVLVDTRGRVQVLDFGIGRFFERGGAGDDEAFGTMPYMAPEQLAGLRGDERVDVFATGLMLYEALTEERPAPANPLGWVTRTCLERPVPLAARVPEVPRRLSRVVEQLLEVDPRRRLSAARGAERLRLVRTTPDTQDWPEPPFVEPGSWWADLETALGDPSAPFWWVLDGPSGSGRRRAVEQLQRHALLHGIRTLHVRCDATSIGGPIVEALEAVLGAGEDEARTRALAGAGAGALRQMWPHLPVPPPEDAEPVPTMSRIAEAAAAVIARAADGQDLLLVVHRLEQIDRLSARALHRLAVLAERALGVVLLHETRWATALSHQVIDGLAARRQARIIALPPLEARAADAVRAAVCPATPPTDGPASPQHAVEQGYAALAAWRGEPWSPPGANLWPLAVHEPIPADVLADLVGGSILDSPWVAVGPGGVRLAGATARRAARSRLADLRSAASAIAEVWEARGVDDVHAASLARLHLLADAPERARAPAARAALHYNRRGRYAEARRWLYLHDALPAGTAPVIAFPIAVARAQVALVTEADEPRDLLVDACDATARTDEERAEATIVRAAWQLRRGEARPALVAALRVASPSRAPSAEIAARALLLASRCRLALEQPADAHAHLTRAEALLAAGPAAHLADDVALLRTEILLRGEQVDAAGAQAEALLLAARRDDHVHRGATAALLLARVLRLVGRRGRAESLARGAITDAGRAGDLALEAEARLELAALLVERGDTAGARPYLDAAIRRLRGLHAQRGMATGLRILLQAATAEGDAHAADLALGSRSSTSYVDPATASALVRWWRTRGDLAAALAVPAPPPGGWAHLAWRVERARTWLVSGDRDAAAREAGSARSQALDAGFDELELYARLVDLAATEADEATWAPTYREAAGSVWTDLCFCALELQARRRERAGDGVGAREIWAALRARCEELGYRPGYEEASGWLGEAR
jgi:hypothetical protein